MHVGAGFGERFSRWRLGSHFARRGEIGISGGLGVSGGLSLCLLVVFGVSFLVGADGLFLNQELHERYMMAVVDF